MSRRTVLAALFARATLAARPGLVRPAGDDAELIRLGAQFQKHRPRSAHGTMMSPSAMNRSPLQAMSGGKF